MSLKKILKAAFKLKNFVLLAFVIIMSYITEFLPFTFIGLAGYFYFVMQTLRSEDFQKEVYETETIEKIYRLSQECGRYYLSVNRRLNRTIDKRIKDMLAEKEEIMREFSNNKDDALKQRIVQQALELIMAYIKLITNFSFRCNEIIEIDVNKIKDRINNNNRKLGFLKNPNAVVDLKKAIEMDQRMLERIESEKSELERISAKLDYMESTIRMFKHQMLSTDAHDETFAEVETIVNEATALDNVLTNNRKNKMKL